MEFTEFKNAVIAEAKAWVTDYELYIRAAPTCPCPLSNMRSTSSVSLH